jgi:hypothetical protein
MFAVAYFGICRRPGAHFTVASVVCRDIVFDVNEGSVKSIFLFRAAHHYESGTAVSGLCRHERS